MTNPNDHLRNARLGVTPTSGSDRTLTRRELAEAVNSHLFAVTGQAAALSAEVIARLERGMHRWPHARYRQALQAVLGVKSDEDLGFFASGTPCGRRTGMRTKPKSDGLTPVSGAAQPPIPVAPVPVRFAVGPGKSILIFCKTPDVPEPTGEPVRVSIEPGMTALVRGLRPESGMPRIVRLEQPDEPGEADAS